MPRLARLARRMASHNIKTIRSSPLTEIAGAFGDIGTLIPLFIALSINKSISLGASLIFTGLANIVTGLVFGLPLPVQPMKAIAAVAIARKLSVEQTACAGLFVSGVVGILSILGLLDWIARVVPIPVVKGIQVGAGLQLISASGAQLFAGLGWMTPAKGDNLWWALIAFFVLLTVTASNSRFPYALIVLVIGLVSAVFTLYDYRYNSNHPAPLIFGHWNPRLIHPNGADFRIGALTAGLGQLPLTTLNSIVAVSHLSLELLPDLPPPAPRSLGISILIMNAIGCTFGAIPACHGSGGLAGQYRFGARSGVSPMILGAIKILLAVIFRDEWLSALLGRFPKALLGVMVVAAGIELVKVGEGLNNSSRDLWELEDRSSLSGRETSIRYKFRELSKDERQDRWAVMVMTVAGLLAFKNDAVGFLAGLLCHWALKLGRQYQLRTDRILRRAIDERTGLLD